MNTSAQTHRFQAGEEITYGVFYHLMGVWVPAGNVTFSVYDTVYRGQPSFHFKGFGKTHKRYDWFYKVRDTYESYASKEDLRPFRFKRNVSEGDFYFVEDCVFNYRDSNIYSVLKVKENPIRLDTSVMEPNSQDVLSMIYHARNLDFETFEIGAKIPVNMFIDRETFQLYIRYLGVEVYDHDEFGEIECYVFSPLLVAGTIFKEGERMKVYVSRDKNLVPIYIESEIRVGSIRAELIQHKGLVGLLLPLAEE